MQTKVTISNIILLSHNPCLSKIIKLLDRNLNKITEGLNIKPTYLVNLMTILPAEVETALAGCESTKMHICSEIFEVILFHFFRR